MADSIEFGIGLRRVDHIAEDAQTAEACLLYTSDAADE